MNDFYFNKAELRIQYANDALEFRHDMNTWGVPDMDVALSDACEFLIQALELSVHGVLGYLGLAFEHPDTVDNLISQLPNEQTVLPDRVVDAVRFAASRLNGMYDADKCAVLPFVQLQHVMEILDKVSSIVYDIRQEVRCAELSKSFEESQAMP